MIAFLFRGWRRLRHTLQRLVSRDTPLADEHDMDEELRAHLELRVQANMAAGMTSEQARRAAVHQFGSVEAVREECRDQRGLRWLENVSRDAVFALRQLKRQPAFTSIAVLTLALGIGVNTAMFSGLRVILRPDLPYPQPDRLVRVFRTSPQTIRGPHAAGRFLDLQEHNSVFERVGASVPRSCNFSPAGLPAERIEGMAATAGFLSLLGVPPIQGRVFTSEEDRPGSDGVVVLTHKGWMRRFNGERDVVGRVLRLDGRPVEVIGILPSLEQDHSLWGDVELIQPMAFSEGERANRSHEHLAVYGRLRPGLSLAQAQAGLDLLTRRLAEQEGSDPATGGLRVVPMANSQMAPQGKRMIAMLMGLAGCVLMIACANLSSLQLARTAARSSEIALRVALGAGRSRLLGQLMTECLLLAAAGGALGLLFAWGGNAVLRSLVQSAGGPQLPLRVDGPVLVFALLATTAAGMAFGLLPAWIASRPNLLVSLRQGAGTVTSARGHARLRQCLIVAQFALALVLLSSAGMVVSGLRAFAKLSPGWRVDGVTVGTLNLPEASYPDADSQRRFVAELQTALERLPGAEFAAVGNALPIGSYRASTGLLAEDRPLPPGQPHPQRHLVFVGPNFFATLGIPLVEGREFNSHDTEGTTPVIIINQRTSQMLWPGESAIGKRIGYPGHWREVVGVARDVSPAADPGEPFTRYQSYVPLAQEPQRGLSIAVRGHVTVEAIRRAVAALDSDLPLGRAGSAREQVDRRISQVSTAGWLLGAFAALGLVLAAIGLYGVLAGFVVQRTREIGLRMALGAEVRDVVRMVLRRGLRLSLMGAVLGVAGAVVLTRLLLSLAPGMQPASLPVVLGVMGVLLGTALAACWIPAQRAARVNPSLALRAD